MTRSIPPRRYVFLAVLAGLLSVAGAGAQPPALTAEERAYLKAHDPIRYAPDPSFAPFEFFDGQGRAVGITPDLLALMGRNLGVEFRSLRYPSWSAVLAAARRGEVDLLGTLTRTPEREAFLRFTRPYLSVPYVLFVRDDRRGVSSLESLGSARLGVVRNYGINHWLAARHPELRPVAVEDARAGLSMLSTGRLDAFLETLPVGLYVLREQSLSNVRMVPGEVYSLPQHLAVGADQGLLAAIMEKGLQSLTPAERTAVFVRWAGQDFSRPQPALPPLIRDSLLALLVLVTLGLGWIVSLRRGIEGKTRALQESEARQRQVIEKSPVAMAVTGPGGTIEYVNEAFKAAVGYTLEDIPTVARWFSRAHPDPEYRAGMEVQWERRLEVARRDGRGIGALECRVTCKDGAVRVFEVDSSPVGDKQVVVLGDVTESRRAAEVLGESEASYRGLYRRAVEQEELYKSLLQSIPDPVALYTLNGEVVYLNPSFTRVFGFTFDEMRGRRVPFVPAGEAERTSAEIRRVLDGQLCTGFETRRLTRDGQVLDIELSSSVYHDHEGNGAGIAVILRDVTERRRAEEALQESERRYRLIADNARDVIWTLGVDGQFTYVSPSVERLRGYTAEEVLSQTLEEALTPDSRAVVEASLREALAREVADAPEEASAPFLLEQPCKDGSTVWTEVVVALIRDANGRLVGVQGVSRDITERKRAEDEKAVLEEQLRHAQKMEAIGTLAGGVAHDFNNILSAIVGYADLTLLRLPPESPHRRYLGEILTAAYRARDLVQQILSLSRRAPQERRPVELAPIAVEALKLLRATLPSTIEIRERIDPAAGSVLADATHLHQVLVNLGTNASYAMRDAGGVLEVSLERAEVEARSGSAPAGPAAGSFVRLTVRDTGSGMDAVVRQRIFEPYFTTKPVGEGSGLGLAVVHGIVTGLGGVIAVESEPGRGTTFEVLLPRLEGGDEPAVAAEVPLPGGNERVLVVDDEDAVVDASRRMLEALGYRVTATTDSEDALARFRAEPSAFDLVLTDHTMPRLTGLELTRQLLAIRPALPVVLCTGYSDRVDEGKAKDAGARGLLLKPLGLRLLAEATRQALDEAAHRPV